MTIDTVGELAGRAGLGEVFTRPEALAAGMSPDQLRGKAVHSVLRGVYTLQDDTTSLTIRARAALALASPMARVCETTALALRGVALPDARLERAVHIWEPLGRHGPTTAGVVVHHGAVGMLGLPRPTLQGMKTVHPAHCWLQAAQRLSVRDLVMLADGLTRRSHPILELARLREAVGGATGRRGVRRARAALKLARPGTDSPMETVLRLILVEAGLPCPVVNLPWYDAFGFAEYWLDMAYPEVRLAVEYDGAGHGDVDQMRNDRTRRRRLEDAGWRIITATADDVANSAPLVASVRRALAARSEFLGT